MIARIQGGESYYPAVVDEQRKVGFPLKPGLAVRLPTLAYVEAAIGQDGEKYLAVFLFAAVMLSWRHLLGSEPGAQQRRGWMFGLILIGAVLGLNVFFYRMHELFAGMLLAISFGLHRPGRWIGSLIFAALALSVRELALPFVGLMAGAAVWRREWREAAAWIALIAVFFVALAIHLRIVDSYFQPGDEISKSWLALRGFSGWLSSVVLSGNLRWFPHWIAGPMVVLTMLGWAGWKSHTGTIGALLYLGYGLSFTVAGRNENWYWAMMITPVMFAGLAFTPMAARSLWRSAMQR